MLYVENIIAETALLGQNEKIKFTYKTMWWGIWLIGWFYRSIYWLLAYWFLMR